MASSILISRISQILGFLSTATRTKMDFVIVKVYKGSILSLIHTTLQSFLITHKKEGGKGRTHTKNHNGDQTFPIQVVSAWIITDGAWQLCESVVWEQEVLKTLTAADLLVHHLQVVLRDVQVNQLLQLPQHLDAWTETNTGNKYYYPTDKFISRARIFNFKVKSDRISYWIRLRLYLSDVNRLIIADAAEVLAAELML